MPAEPADSRRGSCAECGAPLAHDQRYCIGCGARRGPLPAGVAKLIGEMHERSAGAPAIEPAEGPEPEETETASDTWMLRPRAAAVAVMAMLGFGVVAGSFAGSDAQSATGAPILLAVSPATSTAPAPAPANNPSSGGGGSAAPAPASPAAPAAQTVTVPAATTPSGSGGGSAPAAPTTSLPPVKHVFMIVLSDQGYNQSFGPHSAGPYLARTLRKQGELLPNYYAVTAGSLANEVALVSGQGPTPQTAIDCPAYANLSPGTVGKQGQVSGGGCVYPTRTSTLADQLVAQGQTWKSYVEGIGGGPVGEPTTCRHPAIGAGDADWLPRAGDAYVTWRNPFVYFHAVTDATTCAQNDVGLEQLATDIKSPSRAPTLSYIVPSPCDDGSDTPCATGSPSGLAASDTFLRSVIPEIEHSAAYKAGGLIAITFDQAPQSGLHADPSACCNNPTAYPNLTGAPAQSPATARTQATSQTTTTPAGSTTTAPTTTTTTTPTTTAAPTTTTAPTTPTTPAPNPSAPTTTTTATTPTTTTPTTLATTSPSAVNPLASGQTTPTGGGGQVGLLLISQYVKPNSEDTLDFYNHFSLLGSIEDLLGLKHLGYATDPQLPLFFAGTYNAFK